MPTTIIVHTQKPNNINHHKWHPALKLTPYLGPRNPEGK